MKNQRLQQFQKLLEQGPFELLHSIGRLPQLAPCDLRDMLDTQSVAEVAPDCTRYMQQTEHLYMTRTSIPSF